MAANKFQPITLKPPSGVFDARSAADEKPPGSFAWKENFAVNPDGRLARALGWTRAFPSVCYGNSDFHDQGVDDSSREPPTLLFASTANSGVRRLFMGTKTRLFVHDPLASFGDGKGDYTQLTGGPFGNDGSDSETKTRFHAAELNNKVVFTNNLDLVQIHTLGSTTVAPITSLATAGEAGAIAITAARCVIQLGGVIYLLNTVEGGVRIPSRIRWSNLNEADWWAVHDTPHPSIADYQDLDYGEVILSVVVAAGGLRVYTDRSIWQCTPSVAEVSAGVSSLTLDCQRRYTEPRNRAKCLAYPNSLVSTGFSDFYMGADGIYEFNQYMSEPERPEWLHRSTTVIFKDIATRIDKQACNSPIAEYVPGVNEDATAGDGELHFTWPTYSPSVELLPNPNPDCVTYTPIDRVEDDGLNEFTLVANIRHKTADFRDYGSTAMVNFITDVETVGSCNQQAHLILAASADYCLKQADTGYGREMFDVSSGEWSMEGYYSIFRLIFPLEKFDQDKNMVGFAAEILALDPEDPAIVKLRIGTSHIALDPNPNPATGKCSVLWHQLSSKPIKCSYKKTADEYVKSNVRPGQTPDMSWNFYYSGRFLMAELTIAAADGSEPTTGGCTISRLAADVRLV